ncbi:MAG: hypothetical protein HY882_07190 [Deltaproteobacteria bacterium]|nr:hypothetical protein [Deltaproteobacteria bacterium]
MSKKWAGSKGQGEGQKVIPAKAAKAQSRFADRIGRGREINMGLLIDSDVCNGCRICELACSFHHRGVFAPDHSSVKVFSDYREGKIQLIVDGTCDLCPKDPQPMCVQYCVIGALKKGAKE